MGCSRLDMLDEVPERPVYRTPYTAAPYILNPWEVRAAKERDAGVRAGYLCEIHMQIGMAFLRAGKSGQAREAFERSVATGSKDTIAFAVAEAAVDRLKTD